MRASFDVAKMKRESGIGDAEQVGAHRQRQQGRCQSRGGYEQDSVVQVKRRDNEYGADQAAAGAGQVVEIEAPRRAQVGPQELGAEADETDAPDRINSHRNVTALLPVMANRDGRMNSEAHDSSRITPATANEMAKPEANVSSRASRCFAPW